MTGLERCTSKKLVEIDDTKEEVKKEKEIKRLKMFDSFMKVITFAVVFHGLSMVTLSYILAFMDKIQIAESLSQTVVSEIIAPVTVYGITKTFENISKYNTWVETICKFKTDKEGMYDE